MNIEKLRFIAGRWVDGLRKPVAVPVLPPSKKATFEGEPVPVRFGPGTTLYRVSEAGGATGKWWLLRVPSTVAEFRDAFAVKPSWNDATDLFVYTVRDGEHLIGWMGPAAPQSENGVTFEGGDFQVWLELKPPATGRRIGSFP